MENTIYTYTYTYIWDVIEMRKIYKESEKRGGEKYKYI